jgi:anti-sigma-K factor RskA
MSHLCRYRHVVRVLAVFACTLLGLAASAPAAFAMRMEDPGGSSGASLTSKDPTNTFTHTAVTSGMPGWQIAVIAAVATLLVATIAVVVHRVRSAHRGRLVPAA